MWIYTLEIQKTRDTFFVFAVVCAVEVEQNIVICFAIDNKMGHRGVFQPLRLDHVPTIVPRNHTRHFLIDGDVGVDFKGQGR